MKTRAESKTKTRIAIVLGIVALLTVGWSLYSNHGGSSGPAAVAVPTGRVSADSGVESLDPRLHLDLLANSEAVKYEGNGKNIFQDTPEAVKIPAVKISPLLRKQQEAARAALPPPLPPINLKFFGTSNSQGEKPEAFLSDGDDIWVAHEGDVVNRHYKIVHISPTSVDVEDLLNNNRRSIPRTQGSQG